MKNIYRTTIRTRKDFPLEQGEELRVRDGSGRIVEKWTVGGRDFIGSIDVPKDIVSHHLTVEFITTPPA